MRVCVYALVITVIVAMVPSTSGAQAVAEGALTHALSSGMGASLGKTMGRATNQMAGRVAQQTSRSMPHQAAGAKTGVVSTASSQNAPSVQNASAAAPSGSMIVSIQGGVRPQSACNEPVAGKPAAAANAASNSDSQASAASVQNSCASTGDPALYAHPSEITLPAPK